MQSIQGIEHQTGTPNPVHNIVARLDEADRAW